jgi:pilus assembly protein CpaF
MNRTDAVTAVCAALGHEQGDLGEAALGHARRLLPLGTIEEVRTVAETAVAHTSGLGPLQEFFSDPSINEIMVNNGGDVWIERNGEITRAGRLTAEMTPRLLERMLHPLGRRLDRLSPIVDARLADGSRVCAVIPPIALDGACFTLRRFGVQHRPLEQFADPDVAGLLKEIVQSRCNVLISGATSSGKTSLLNALAAHFAAAERIITLEDTAELSLEASHVLRLETRAASPDGLPAVTMTDLVRASLRLRPDRLIVGEIRGAEVIDMVQAMNTGHDGSFTTLHANSPLDALRRVEALLMQHAPTWPLEAIRDQIRSGIDVVIHVARTASGQRRIVEIVELGRPDLATTDQVLSVGDDVRRGLLRMRTLC